MVRINASALASYLFRGRGLILMMITWPVDNRISAQLFCIFVETDHRSPTENINISNPDSINGHHSIELEQQ